MAAASTLAVVILNYNGQPFLYQFLPSVVAYSTGYDIIVADNASTDGSVSWLKSHYPTVRLIELPTNTGYAGGYNRALAQVKTDYYVLLNSDVEVTPNWLTPIVQLLDSQPQIAACQPKLLAYHQRNLFEYAGGAGGYLDRLGYAFCRGRIFDTCETDTGQYNDTCAVCWASGACLFVRSKVFDELGGFDESFFAHFEEIDLCWRIQLTNRQVYYCADSTVFHVGAGTLPVTSPFKTYLNYRNNLAMLYKNLPDGKVWPIVLQRLVLDGISAVRFLPKLEFKNIWAVIRAHFAFYAMIPSLRKKRQSSIANYPVTTYSKSIIWEYFVKKKKVFGEL
jgi:GT2 family glycosyltransferase